MKLAALLGTFQVERVARSDDRLTTDPRQMIHWKPRALEPQWYLAQTNGLQPAGRWKVSGAPKPRLEQTQAQTKRGPPVAHTK